jgi:hypothetical protein
MRLSSWTEGNGFIVIMGVVEVDAEIVGCFVGVGVGVGTGVGFWDGVVLGTVVAVGFGVEVGDGVGVGAAETVTIESGFIEASP